MRSLIHPPPVPDIEHRIDFFLIQPRGEAALDTLPDRGTRDERPGVGPEAQPREPRVTDEVGGGHALQDSPAHEMQHRAALEGGEPRRPELGRQLGLEVKGMENKGHRLVQGIAVPVPEAETGFPEAARAPAHVVAQARQAVLGLIGVLPKGANLRVAHSLPLGIDRTTHPYRRCTRTRLVGRVRIGPGRHPWACFSDARLCAGSQLRRVINRH